MESKTKNINDHFVNESQIHAWKELKAFVWNDFGKFISLK